MANVLKPDSNEYISKERAEELMTLSKEENDGQPPISELERIALALECSVEDVQELSRQFNKQPSELPDLLGSLKWTADKVLKFGAVLAPTYMSVKFQFSAVAKNAQSGAFCMVVDGRNGKIIDETYGILSKGTAQLNPASAWEGFRQKILAMQGPLDRSDIPRLHKIAHSIFTASVLREVFAQQKGQLKTELQMKLQKLIEGNYQGAASSQIVYERFSAARLQLGGFKPDLPEVHVPEPEVTKPEILCRAVVDPLHGKACYDLDKNDRIWVQLTDGPGINGVVFRLFQYLQADPVFPVESMEELPTGMIALRFPITDEISGVVNVMQDLRIKVFNPHEKKSSSIYFLAFLAFLVGIAITIAIGYML